MNLPLTAIREDLDVQLRAGSLHLDRVMAMIEFEESGGRLPPVTVVGEDNLLADGHHRLYAAKRAGKREIAADRVPGGKAEAIVIAIRQNDLSTTLPLTRDERNEGVRLLLEMGWTQEKVGEATGVHQTTIRNIQNALAMRGKLVKRVEDGKGHRTPKRVAVLPPDLAAPGVVSDTILYRVATLDVDDQVPFVQAAVDARLSEPRVREAVRAIASEGMTPAEAVASVAPITRERPVDLPGVAKQARVRLERFLEEPMTVLGVERNFWAVLDVLAENVEMIPLEAKGLSRLLSEVSVQADLAASRLANGASVKAIRA